jgi:hypothetical protein
MGGLKVRYSDLLSYNPSDLELRAGIEPAICRLRNDRIAIYACAAIFGAPQWSRTTHHPLTRRLHRHLCLRGLSGATP